MNSHDVERSSTTAGLPISPGLGPTLEQAHIIRHPNVLDSRTLFICRSQRRSGARNDHRRQGTNIFDRFDH